MHSPNTHHPFRSARAKGRYLAFYDRKAELWPVSSTGKLVSTSFGDTFVRVSGKTGSQPLVLLPGGSANSLMWWPNITAFSRHFKVYAIDNLFDFGKSVYTRRPHNQDDIVAWLDELFDALGFTAKIHLVGLSFGGWMASQYALHRSERIEKVVLLAPANTVLMVRPEFGLRALSTLLPLPFLTKKFIYWLFEDLVTKDEAGKRLADEMVAEMVLSFQCFKRMPVLTPTVLTDNELLNFKVSTLFLIGENEKIYSAQEAEQRVRRHAPNWQISIIPASGHDLIYTQPEMVNNTIIEFLGHPLSGAL